MVEACENEPRDATIGDLDDRIVLALSILPSPRILSAVRGHCGDGGVDVLVWLRVNLFYEKKVILGGDV